jgi:NAD(P)-dependent dehydrogenase (short-subunit alcohol dehydrogenase family)
VYLVLDVIVSINELGGDMNLNGKVAIVTGGAQGIGRAVVERFTEVGASAVVIADIQDQEAVNCANQIMNTYGGSIISIPTDVSQPEQVRRMVQATQERFGRIDILVNNASLCPVIAWDDVTIENWNRILAVNLTGMLLCTQSVIPLMKNQQFGRIVFVSSEAAFNGSYTAHVAYGVTKAGELALMKSVAKGFASYNILANAITCGPVDTPLGRNLGAEFWAESDKRTLLKRHAAAHEIADAVLFLVSSRSAYITGQVLRINGGMNLT